MLYLENWDWVYPTLHQFMSGIACGLSAVAALLFLRYYRKTKDRLFLCFAAAFAALSGERLGYLLEGLKAENHAFFYFIRLAAFVLILYAILDKNRGNSRDKLNRRD